MHTDTDSRPHPPAPILGVVPEPRSGLGASAAQRAPRQNARMCCAIDDNLAVDDDIFDANRELFGVAFGRRRADLIWMKDNDVCFHSITQQPTIRQSETLRRERR